MSKYGVKWHCTDDEVGRCLNLYLCLSQFKESGQGDYKSIAMFALMAGRFLGRLTTIDMKPKSINKKLEMMRYAKTKIISHINFQRGFSIGGADLKTYFNRSLDSIGGVSFENALSHAGDLIDSALDARKLRLVLKALNIESLTVDTLKNSLLKEGNFAPNLLDTYRSDGDELIIDCKENIS